MDSDLKRKLIELNQEVAKRLWAISEGSQIISEKPKLIFPIKRDQSVRISEQESRVIFCQLLEKSCWYYSIETPTQQEYQQKGKGYRSGGSDLSLYTSSSPDSKIVNIELKAHNPPKEHFKKDFEKLIREGLDGMWFHTIYNVDRGTMRSICRKIVSSFEDLKSNFKSTDKTLLFAFCILGRGKDLIEVEINLEGSTENCMKNIGQAFSRFF